MFLGHRVTLVTWVTWFFFGNFFGGLEGHVDHCWRFCKGPPQALVTLPPWPLTWITQRKRLVSYQFIFMSWSKSQSHSRVLDVDALTTLVLLTSWQHSTVKVTRFTSSTDFHFLLDIALNINATLQTERGFGLADFATQSTQLVQNKHSYNVSNTSQSCCSCLETACRSPPLPRNECI